MFLEKDKKFNRNTDFLVLGYIIKRPIIEPGPGDVESVYITPEEYNIILDNIGDFLSIVLLFLFFRWLKRRYLTRTKIINFLMKL